MTPDKYFFVLFVIKFNNKDHNSLSWSNLNLPPTVFAIVLSFGNNRDRKN